MQSTIKKLLIKVPQKRLGNENGIADIKSEKIFVNVQWALLHNKVPPLRHINTYCETAEENPEKISLRNALEKYFFKNVMPSDETAFSDFESITMVENLHEAQQGK
ncbi:hypothetical protein ROZALSC1DRAFT_27114 [Rozella allomycis CSF55]|uniref:Uncharacterized protein n=1 Tax=Rozella allomycis (strain CSF55) TaxID=988480 RepID=A0A075AWS2_ROZAC|nr:hypothetical protein O9G_002761 [Rozella allomycis CSF55]RKP21499.1 hypothetical protein ROZALSC1DRAFT_27114 [Rozella allomycis CSF55]|eukprot:EPZ34697.1 hypothetical protein O9G_002761 [Rozella allomycis CSF55]